MKVIYLPFNEQIKEEKVGTLLLGTFDGVHRGHQRVILEARLDGFDPLAVLLFEEPPSFILPIHKRKEVLTSLEDKLSYFALNGVEIAYILTPSKDYYAMIKEEFLTKVLLPLKPSLLVFGEDYRFGKGAEGTPSYLREFFSLKEVPLFCINGEKASTQTIGNYLEAGEIEKANFMLGHYYAVKGKIIPGFHNGKKMGFPTMNLSLNASYLLPKPGVYFSIAWLEGKPYRAITNVGKNPTIGLLKENRIETHLLGYDEESYGKEIEVDFLSFMRDEEKFASLDELEAQLKKDKEEAKHHALPSLR